MPIHWNGSSTIVRRRVELASCKKAEANREKQIEKGIPVERRGRKATGLQGSAYDSGVAKMSGLDHINSSKLGRTWVERLLQSVFPVLIALALSGCLDDSKDPTTGEAQLPGAENPSDPTNPAPADPEPPADPAPVNHAPEIAGTPPASVVAGEMYSFVPTASDADNDFLEFTITNQPAWASFSDETGALTGTPADADVGESEDITITVTDGRDTRSVGPFRIRINPRSQPPAPPSNSPPTLSGAPAGVVLVGSTYAFRPSASDADGDSLRFSIANRPSWASFSTTTGTLTGTPRTRHIGTYSNIVISVSDGSASSAIGPFAIQVQGPDNRAPTISGSPATSVEATQTYSFMPVAEDPDGDTLTYSIANRPAWASFSTSTGRLTGTPTASHVGTYANIVISVSDGRASASLGAFSIKVQAAPNQEPTIKGTPATSVKAGTAYSFTPTADDPDDDTLGFTIQNRPSWATFNTSTGRLSGTPTSANVGTFSGITISVSDGRATASLPAFSIRVEESANREPTISGTPATSVNVGAAYTFQPVASDADGDTLTYSIQNRPAWATFNTSTGRLSGTPTASSAGEYANIVISVTDGTASASLPAFTITVKQSANGSAILSWQAPTENVDGTPLTNLAGFRIAYGSSPSSLSTIVELANPGLTTHTVTGLGSGTWYFAVRAYTTSGAESDLSNIASKTIP